MIALSWLVSLTAALQRCFLAEHFSQLSGKLQADSHSDSSWMTHKVNWVLVYFLFIFFLLQTPLLISESSALKHFGTKFYLI